MKVDFLCDMFLFKHVIEEPIFDILRTKEQLGYEKLSLIRSESFFFFKVYERDCYEHCSSCYKKRS